MTTIFGEQSAPPGLVPGESSLPNLRILVIDDADAIHEDFRKVLTNVGPEGDDATEAEPFGPGGTGPRRTSFTVDSAHQGEEGLRRVEQARAGGQPYAMAFVDVRMP